MSISHVSNELRRAVFLRAQHRCEYCLIHDADTYLGCSIDHIISEKHGGPTEFDNLATACVICNRLKGSDIASIDALTSLITPLFNPRRQNWHEHFRIESERIVPVSASGRTTERLLRLNSF